MKYVIPAIILLVLLPLTILAAIWYMRTKQTPTAIRQTQQGNAPVFAQQVLNTSATVVDTSKNIAESLKALQGIVGSSVPDDSHFVPDPSQADSAPFYQWGTSPDSVSTGVFDFTMPN